MDNITDPIKQREAHVAKKDVNYYFFGSPLFDGCSAAAAAVPSAVQNIIDLASGKWSPPKPHDPLLILI